MAAVASSVPVTQFETVRGLFSNIGVRQLGDPVLHEPTRPIDLPKDSALASEILDCLQQTIKAARKLHGFSRGVGLAAPQLGLRRRVAVVQPYGEMPMRLINPRVISRSRKTDVQFEGCLSFFDYRGEVRRPIAVTVEYDDLRGRPHEVALTDDAARLALHEIDHLDGLLYLDRMTSKDRLIEASDKYP